MMYLISFILFVFLGWRIRGAYEKYKMLSMKNYVKEVMLYEKKLREKEINKIKIEEI